MKKFCAQVGGVVSAILLCVSLAQAQVVAPVTVYNPVDFNLGQPTWIPANQVEATCCAIGPAVVGQRVLVANLSGGLWDTDGVGLYTNCALGANRSIGLTTGVVVDTPAGLSVAVDRVVTVKPRLYWNGGLTSVVQLPAAGTAGSYRTWFYANSTSYKKDEARRVKQEEADKTADAKKAPAKAEDPAAAENNTLPFGPAAPAAAPGAAPAAPAAGGAPASPF